MKSIKLAFKKTIENINKIKSWFFERVNKMTNLWPDSPKRGKNSNNKINEKAEISIDSSEKT